MNDELPYQKVAQCVDELIDQGMDEGTHHWNGYWLELSDDELKGVLADPESFTRMIEELAPLIQDRLEKAITDRARERCGHHQQDQRECMCICHEPASIIIHDHACCSPCSKCGFRVKCTCEHCKREK